MTGPACDMHLKLQAEFDGELDAAQSAELATHRESCDMCRASWDRLARTRAALAEGVTYHRASPALQRAIASRIAAPAPQAARRFRRWREGVSFVAGGALAAMLMLALLPSAQDGMVAALIDDHIRSLQPGHLIDVVSSDQHTVKPWFDGRLDFAPPVKDLAAQGFPLQGGRLDYLAGRSVAALAYGRQKHIINLFVWPQGGSAGASAPAAMKGYNIVHWSAEGMNFWAVSDLERGELEAFSRDWQQTP
jgi:anti-sigma factor RsiW